MAGLAGSFTVRNERGAVILAAVGRWDAGAARLLDAPLRAFRAVGAQTVRFDLSQIERFDTAGAWLVWRTQKRLAAEGSRVELAGLDPVRQALLDEVAANDRPVRIEPDKRRGLARIAERTGKTAVQEVIKGRNFVAFLGLIVATLARALMQPSRLRLTSIVYHIEQVGLNALPIVGLISFLIGIVLAYQGASQLQQFGAEVFVVNLIAISVLRELGILLTAIIIAGRSGSAFTAQIGAMKVHEEVDAMRALGLDPMEILVLPRVIALVIALPLLAFFADIMDLLGGALMAWFTLDVSPAVFIDRLRLVASFWTVSVGLIKAPVFALLIAMVGCYEGLRVEGSAESVGKLTTRAVVESIFLVIVVDALFSIFFATIGT